MPMKLLASVLPTLGRSSVKSMTRVEPANLCEVASWKPTARPSSMLVEPALAMPEIWRAIAGRSRIAVGCMYTCERSP